MLGSIADFNFAFAGKVNDILPPWSGMPTVDIVGGNVPKNDPFTRLEFVDLHLDLVKMRLAVHSAIEPHDFHKAVS